MRVDRFYAQNLQRFVFFSFFSSIVFKSEKVRASNIDDVSIDNLVDEVTPIGRDQVPAEIKNEILLKLRAFLDEEA